MDHFHRKAMGNQWIWPFELFQWFFLFDFTLFVIDIHHIMLISLFPTPFDHFHSHPTLGLDPALILTLRHKLSLMLNLIFYPWTFVHVVLRIVLDICRRGYGGVIKLLWTWYYFLSLLPVIMCVHRVIAKLSLTLSIDWVSLYSPRCSSWANAGGRATCAELDISFRHIV